MTRSKPLNTQDSGSTVCRNVGYSANNTASIPGALKRHQHRYENLQSHRQMHSAVTVQRDECKSRWYCWTHRIGWGLNGCGWCLCIPAAMTQRMYRDVTTVLSMLVHKVQAGNLVSSFPLSATRSIHASQWLSAKPKLKFYNCLKQLSVYAPVVTICTASLTFNNSMFCPHSVFMCFVWISEQIAFISLYSINWLVFISETECVYCAVQTRYLTFTSISVFRHLPKIAKRDYQLRHVCPSVRIEQLRSHWADLHKIWHLSIFRKSEEEIQVSVQSDKNYVYFTWRPMYIYSNI
jgi:hypothetical protein